jgi:hypothetical protein
MKLSSRLFATRVIAAAFPAVACGRSDQPLAPPEAVPVPPRDAAAFQTDRLDYLVRYRGSGVYSSRPGDSAIVTFSNAFRIRFEALP